MHRLNEGRIAGLVQDCSNSLLTHWSYCSLALCHWYIEDVTKCALAKFLCNIHMKNLIHTFFFCPDPCGSELSAYHKSRFQLVYHWLRSRLVTCLVPSHYKKSILLYYQLDFRNKLRRKFYKKKNHFFQENICLKVMSIFVPTSIMPSCLVSQSADPFSPLIPYISWP